MGLVRRVIDYDKPRPVESGPTPERLKMAAGHTVEGGDERGGVKTRQMLDAPLERLYSRLQAKAKRDAELDELRAEYHGLTEYRRLFFETGMMGMIGSVDFNGGSYGTTGRSFLPKNDRQLDGRDKLWHARQNVFSLHQSIVVDNVVLNEHSLEVAGYSIGKTSKTRAIAAAEKNLREAGALLAERW